MANFQIRVLFTINYFLFIVPFSIAARFFARFPGPGWHSVDGPDKTSLEDARRQF
ncbi:hypothetical protein ACFLTD_00315 [Elusimicrobiota bacterium]